MSSDSFFETCLSYTFMFCIFRVWCLRNKADTGRGRIHSLGKGNERPLQGSIPVAYHFLMYYIGSDCKERTEDKGWWEDSGTWEMEMKGLGK